MWHSPCIRLLEFHGIGFIYSSSWKRMDCYGRSLVLFISMSMEELCSQTNLLMQSYKFITKFVCCGYQLLLTVIHCLVHTVN
jgi:hypothetical protein